MEFIWSEEELKNFFENIMPRLSDGEVYFLSLSARNKYLSEDEKEYFKLGRNEMFERTVVREQSFEKFLKKVHGFDRNSNAYLTKNSLPIPSNCMVCYININPSNVLKAYNEFTKIMNDYMMELGLNSFNNSSTSNVEQRIKKADVLLMNCIQKNRGHKSYLDVDFDIPKEHWSAVEVLLEELEENKVEYVVIDTKSGYHVLIKKNTLNYNFNNSIELSRKYLRKKGVEDFEVVLNKNEMIPLPGTYQAGHPVRVIITS